MQSEIQPAFSSPRTLGARAAALLVIT